MLIREALDVAVEGAKQVKDMAVKDARGHGPDSWVKIAVGGYRGRDLVVNLVGLDGSGQVVVSLVQVAASLYRCEVVSAMWETWYSTVEESPLTGKPWRPGELQEAVERHQGREKGWVQDALLVSAVNRAGDIATAILPYRPARRRTEWQPTREGALTGLMIDGFKQVMQATDLAQTMARHGFTPDTGLSEEQYTARLDCIVTRQLRTVPWVPPCVAALGAVPGSPRDQVLKTYLPEAKVIHPNTNENC